MNTYPRESVEFEATQVTASVAGVATIITTGVSFAVTTELGRPTTYTPAIILNGQTGFMVGNYTVGQWHKWARVDSFPETPVIDCGWFTIS